LVNPSNPTYQLTGVYAPGILPLYDHVLKNSLKRYAVVHAVDVYDEVSLTCDFHLYSHNGINKYSPADLGLSVLRPEDIGGGDTVEEAAVILKNVLSGKGTKAQHEVVAANAGLAIHVAKDVSLKEGIAEALDIINEGKGINVLEALIH